MREFDPCCLAEYLGDVDYFKCELAMEEDDEGEYDDDADNAEGTTRVSTTTTLTMPRPSTSPSPSVMSNAETATTPTASPSSFASRHWRSRAGETSDSSSHADNLGSVAKQLIGYIL
jgi:hypothetical protein